MSLSIDEISSRTKAAANQRARVRWIDLARSIHALEKSNGAPFDANGIRWSDHVAKAAQLKGTQIVAILRAYAMLDQLAASGEIESVDEYAELTVDALDTINRYLTIDRPAAVTALKSRPNSREARRLYANALSTQQTTHDRSQRIGRAVKEIFQARCIATFGILYNTTLKPGPGNPTKIDGHPHMETGMVLALDQIDRITTGMHARQYSSLPVRSSYRTHLLQSLLDASFIDRLWVIVDDRDAANRLDADLSELEVGNIGIVLIPPAIDPGSPFAHEVLRSITAGPRPDRRHLLVATTTAARSVEP